MVLGLELLEFLEALARAESRSSGRPRSESPVLNANQGLKQVPFGVCVWVFPIERPLNGIGGKRARQRLVKLRANVTCLD